MNIIVNADDFGYSEETVESTIKLFETKTISSATIMASMPGTEYAIDFAKSNHNYSFGLHLNFINDDIESPLIDHTKIPSLTKKNGYFYDTKTLRKLSILNKIDPLDIELETMAQLERVTKFGINISHFDSHGHIHKLPIFSKTLSIIKNKSKINKIRNVQNIFFQKKYLNLNYLFGYFLRKNIINNFKTTDHFFMNSNYSDFKWPEKLLNLKLKGSLEVGIHPGSIQDWRLQEVETCKILKKLINSSDNYHLINWHDI